MSSRGRSSTTSTASTTTCSTRLPLTLTLTLTNPNPNPNPNPNQCLTAPFFRAHVHPALPAFLGAGEATSYADLTLWAAVIGNDGLMRLFWARAPSNQVALALLCAYTMRRKVRGDVGEI